MLITGVGNVSLLSTLSLCFCVFPAQHQHQQWQTKGQNVSVWCRDTVLVFGLPGSRGTLADIPALSEGKHEVKIMSVA